MICLGCEGDELEQLMSNKPNIARTIHVTRIIQGVFFCCGVMILITSNHLIVIIWIQRPNGRRYWQVRELAGKTTRRRIRRWGRIPKSEGESPHLSSARGVGPVFACQEP